MSINSVKNDTIAQDSIVAAQKPLPPTITGYSVDGLDDTALDPAGGQTVLVNGTNFQRGATITFNGSAISVVSWISSSQLSFTSPAYSAGTYQLYVVNIDGGTAIYLPGVVYSTLPTWVTAQGTLGSYYETKSISNSVSASGDAPLTYSLYAGSLPSGATLNSDGTITGTAPAESGSNTYQFTIEAVDAQLQSSTRLFSITINTDVVTWVTPSSGTTVQLDGTSYSQTLSATAATGYSVSYSADTLPTGLTLSDGTISGTPTNEETVETVLTATAATSNRSATNAITWVVSLNDTYWKYNALLLSANAQTTFISDASTNNWQLVTVGTTRADNFNPFQPGYYSTLFNGSSDYLAILTNSAFNIGANDFTVECWINTSSATQQTIFNISDTGSTGYGAVRVQVLSDKTVQWLLGPGGSWGVAVIAGSITHGSWNHIAITRNVGSVYFFINGTQVGTTQTYASSLTTGGTSYIGINSGTGYYMNGYVSNFRFINGIALYASNFTPSTTPLTSVTGTSWLGCQAPSIIDNSPNRFSVSLGGAPKTQPAHPFTNVYQDGTQYYSTKFNGSTDYLTVSHNTALNLSSGDYTVEAWIFSAATPAANQLIVDKGGVSGSTYEEYSLALSSANKIVIYIGAANGSTYQTATTTGGITIGIWNHIAWTKSGSSHKIYINGVVQGTLTQTITMVDNGASLYIGYQNNAASNRFFNGSISNVRIVKGVVVYTDNFVPSTSPLTAVSGTSLLTCQDSTFKDNSTNNFTITPATTTVRPTTVHPTVFDPTYYGSSFSGSNYLSVAANSAFTLGTQDHTIEFWMFLSGSQNGYATQWKYSSGSTQQATNDYYFQAASAGGATFSLLLGAGGSWGVNINGGAYYTAGLNRWTHVAITRSGNSFRLFANGTQVGSTITYSGSIAAQGNAMNIGQDGSSNYHKGMISNFRFTVGQALYTGNFTPPTAPLSTTSIGTTGANVAASLTGSVNLLTCKSSLIIDESTNVFNITNNSNVTPAAVSPFTQPTNYSSNEITAFGSGYFAGSTDYVSTANNPVFYPGTSDFTVEFWMYHTNWAGGYGPGIGQGYKSGPTGGWTIYRNTVLSNGMGVRLATQSGASFTDFFSTTVPSNNVWQHWALVRSGTTLKWYLNGVQDNVLTSFTANITDTDTTSLMYVGYSQQWGYYFGPGYLSNVRYTKGTALYTSNFVPPINSQLTNVNNTKLLTLQNNTNPGNSQFKDLSYFGNLITRPANTNTTNGTFSPYGDNWSWLLNASANTYITFSSSTVIPSTQSTFTIEAWVFLTANSVTQGSNVSGMFCDESGVTNYLSFGPVYNGTNHKVGLYWYDSTGKAVQGDTVLSLNVWYHIAVSVNSNTIRMFVNGQQQTLTGTSTLTNRGGNSGAYCIGQYYYANYSIFKGYLSNLRVVSGTSLYNEAFTPSSSPLTMVNNTTLLICQSNRVIDNSPNNFTLSTSGTGQTGVPSVQKFSPFSTVTVPKYYSIKFDGNGDHITTPASTNNLIYYPAGTDFTMECWVYPTAAVANQDIFGSYSGATTGRWLLYTNTDGLTPIWYQYPSLNGTFTTGSGAMTLNAWNHIAVVRIGDTTKGYLNGVERLSSTATYNLDGGTASVYIGTGYTGRTMFNGYISNLRMVRGVGVYTGAFTPPSSPLTATQTAGTNIAAITGTQTVLLTCQSNTIVDNSTNLYTLTGNADAKPLPVSPFTPTASSATNYSPTVFGGSMYFDGTGDALTSPASSPLVLSNSDFTVEFWEYNEDTSDRYLFSIGDGWSVSTGVCLIHYQGSYALSGGGTPVTGLGSVKSNQWNHIALSRYGGNINLYVNGIYTGQEYVSTNSLTENILKLGTASAGSWPNYKGYISDLRITRGTALYKSNFYPGSTPTTVNSSVALLLSGTSNGIIDQTRTVDLETVADTKVTNFSPYNGSYYSNYFSSSSYLTTPANAAYDLVGSGGNFTLEAWVYFNSYNTMASSAAVIAGNYLTSNGWFWGWYGVGTISYLTYTVFPSGTAANFTMGTTDIPLGRWLHIATVNNNGTLTSYINGVQIGSSQSTPSYTGSGGRLAIGVYQQNMTYAGNPNWYIKDVRIIKGTAVVPPSGGPTAPLTSVSGTSLLTCQSNKFIDNSTNNATVTVNNGTVKVSTQNPFQNNTGTSMYFDGTGDYLTTVNASTTMAFGTGDFTIEFWFYMNTLGTGAIVLDFRPGSTNGLYPTFYVPNGTTTLRYLTNSADRITSDSGTIVAGNWYHVALVRASSVTKLYINGNQAGSNYNDTNSYLCGTNRPIAGASGYDTTGLLNGYITDLRITKGYARTITVPAIPYKTN